MGPRGDLKIAKARFIITNARFLITKARFRIAKARGGIAKPQYHHREAEHGENRNGKE